jgi:hypothetical protein
VIESVESERWMMSRNRSKYAAKENCLGRMGHQDTGELTETSRMDGRVNERYTELWESVPVLVCRRIQRYT